MKYFFDLDFIVEADILPVVPGRLFDRMSIGYLQRDHKERGKSIYHFYLAYFKPLWTDCPTEAYSSEYGKDSTTYLFLQKGSVSSSSLIPSAQIFLMFYLMRS